VPEPTILAGRPISYCTECASPLGLLADHTEVECLRTQIARLKKDRDSWKDAWFTQREATGRVAWQWRAPWMLVHLARHTQGPT